MHPRGIQWKNVDILLPKRLSEYAREVTGPELNLKKTLL